MYRVLSNFTFIDLSLLQTTNTLSQVDITALANVDTRPMQTLVVGPLPGPGGRRAAPTN